ncbi:DUF2478 domain-containing protein [Roseibium sp. HPY-6]|uniref:DUF2478 domain-containing protein n=1 Tax=Roseibium sp. HPY-6 TaxID=3229852 RepID=UPI00338DE5DF
MFNVRIQVPPLTALIRKKGDQADPLLLDAAHRLVSSGRNVVGVIQERVACADSCCDDFYLRDLRTGESIHISQQLGSGSRGCRLNYERLADALVNVKQQLNEPADALILNRFGYSESQGGGLRPLIEAAFEFEVPVLLAVNPTYQQAWRDYAGMYSSDLPANRHSVEHWLELVLQTASSRRATA